MIEREIHYRGNLTDPSLLFLLGGDPEMEFRFSGKKQQPGLGRVPMGFKGPIATLLNIVAKVPDLNSFWSKTINGQVMSKVDTIAWLRELLGPPAQEPHDPTPLKLFYLSDCGSHSAYIDVLHVVERHSLNIKPEIDGDRNLVSVSGETSTVNRLVRELNFPAARWSIFKAEQELAATS